MGKAERSRCGDTNEQEHTLFSRRALSSGREYVQSQNGIDSLRQSYRTDRISCKSEHRTISGRVHGSTHIPEKNERVLAISLSPDDHD